MSYTINLSGADDSAVISGDTTGSLIEDSGRSMVSGSVAISDADADDLPTFSDIESAESDKGYGSYALVSGRWSYNLSNPPLLSDGETATDTFTLTASDGSTQIITITIHGADAAPVLTAPVAGSIDEIAGSAETKTSGLTGTLIASDADGDRLAYGITGGSTSNGASTLAGDYGSLSVNTSTGVYVYLPNESAIEALDEGDRATDSFALTVSDGLLSDSATYSVTVTGADDNCVISGDATGSLNDDLGSTVSGSLVISDVDADDAPIFADIESASSDQGYGTYSWHPAVGATA